MTERSAPSASPARRVRRAAWYRRAKRLARRVTGREVWVRRQLRIATADLPGWTVVPALLAPGAVVWSAGIGTRLDFERALAERFGARVFAFDPSPACVVWVAEQTLPAGLSFHRWALGHQGPMRLHARKGRDPRDADTMLSVVADGHPDARSVEVPGVSFDGALQRLELDRVDLLKLDIEGAEYPVIEQLLASGVRPTQLLVEFHHRFPGIGLGATRGALRGLAAAGYRVAAVSDTGRELTLVRADTVS